jgi:hypothetical protein
MPDWLLASSDRLRHAPSTLTFFNLFEESSSWYKLWPSKYFSYFNRIFVYHSSPTRKALDALSRRVWIASMLTEMFSYPHRAPTGTHTHHSWIKLASLTYSIHNSFDVVFRNFVDHGLPNYQWASVIDEHEFLRVTAEISFSLANLTQKKLTCLCEQTFYQICTHRPNFHSTQIWQPNFLKIWLQIKKRQTQTFIG